MGKYAVLTLKVIGGVVALFIVLLVAAWFALNTSSVQQKLLGYAKGLLMEKLQTQVEIDSIHVNLTSLDVSLMGLDLEDRQQRKMLQVDELEVGVSLMALLKQQIHVSKAELNGVRARIYQPEDSAANYQFVIDAFKRDKSKEKSDTTKKKQKKQRLTFDINNMSLSNIDLMYHQEGKQKTNRCSLAQLTLQEQDQKILLDLDSLHFTIDNHQPRKNVGKPHRGAFDAGHLNIIASLQLAVNHYAKDTVNVTVTRCVATDQETGSNVKDLRLTAGINKEEAHLSDVHIQQESTVLTFDSAPVVLPSKKQGRKLSYQTSQITGTTLLKDISKPFAPVLGRFTMPLTLTVNLSGTDSTMQFSNIHVENADKRLKIDADGGIEHLKEKELLAIRFHVKEMTTDSKTATDIINFFAVKKFMMKQLAKLGTIRYTGDLAILRKREEFKGKLGTATGKLNFNFAIDEKTKYVVGHVDTKTFHLGRILDMPDIGDVSCDANFRFDISKPRTAQIRRKKGGKLPIGQVVAHVAEASYNKIKVKNINTSINSDGAIALGKLSQLNKNVDLLCDFSFTNTDSIHKMKIKPTVKLHDMPWQKKKNKSS